jgi:hypothetical protein
MIRPGWIVPLAVLAAAAVACQPSGAPGPVPTSGSSATASQVLPTAAPQATETSMPAGPRDFTEVFDAASPYWAAFETNGTGPDVQVQDGHLRFNLGAATTWAYSIYEGQDYQAVRLDTQVEVLSGADGAVGLVCRYTETSGWYELNIYAGGTYTLLYGRWLAEGVARYAPMYQGNSEKIEAGTNQIGLLCQGNTLTPFINNVQMKVYEDHRYGLQDGLVGLTAASFNDIPFAAAFDWVKVSEPASAP